MVTLMRDLAAANARIRELEARVAELTTTAMAYAKERDGAIAAMERLEVHRASCCLAAERYVAACLAIREAPYPSPDFTKAVTEATERYHALVEAFPQAT